MSPRRPAAQLTPGERGPEFVRLTVEIARADVEAVDAAAGADGTSRAAILRAAVREWVARRPQSTEPLKKDIDQARGVG